MKPSETPLLLRHLRPRLALLVTRSVVLLAVLFVVLVPVAGAAAEPPPAEPPPGKKAVAAARLLLPYFEVDMSDPNGASTIFTVRNETTQPVDVRFSYFAADRPTTPLFEETLTLPGKRLEPKLVRNAPGLVIDDDGFARGYVVLEALSGDPVIQGDFFQVTPDEGFATGQRLLNIDPASSQNDLCSVFTIRFLEGQAFDGTDLVVWLDLEEQPSGLTPLASYAVYDEAGELHFVSELFASEVAFRRSVADLVSILPIQFGVLEIQLADGVNGHISAMMKAFGLYSVGLEAACGN